MVYILVFLCFIYVGNMINVMPALANTIWEPPRDPDEDEDADGDDGGYIRVPHVYRLAVQAEDQPFVVGASAILACLFIAISIDHPAPWLLFPEIAALMTEAVIFPMSFRVAIYLDLFAYKYPKTELTLLCLGKVCTGAGLLIAWGQV